MRSDSQRSRPDHPTDSRSEVWWWLAAAGVLSVMIGLVPLALHSTGAGYEPAGLALATVGSIVTAWATNRLRVEERRADRSRAYVQYAMVRTSPFAAGSSGAVDCAQRRPSRVRVACQRVDRPELTR